MATAASTSSLRPLPYAGASRHLANRVRAIWRALQPAASSLRSLPQIPSSRVSTQTLPRPPPPTNDGSARKGLHLSPCRAEMLTSSTRDASRLHIRVYGYFISTAFSGVFLIYFALLTFYRGDVNVSAAPCVVSVPKESCTFRPRGRISRMSFPSRCEINYIRQVRAYYYNVSDSIVGGSTALPLEPTGISLLWRPHSFPNPDRSIQRPQELAFAHTSTTC